MRFLGIDPASKTGFVAINENDEVLRAKELTGIGNEDPKRMTTLIDDIVAHLKPGDVICIEGFPYSTQRAMFAGGLHHGIRNELYRRKLNYFEVAPNAVKKFVNVTGWIGEPGNKRPLKGSEKKKAVMQAVYEHFGFQHPSDNVVDAYIMAKIAKSLWLTINHVPQSNLASYQTEVIKAILNKT